MHDASFERPSVAVVIRSFNEEQHIGRLLTGLAHQTVQPQEIVVVDSGSSDATAEIATRFGAKVRQIDPRTFSFGRSLNVGCAAVSSDIIVIASAHVYPTHDTWLEHLIAPFSNDKVALTYGRQIGDERTKFSEHQLLLRWFPTRSNFEQRHPFCNNANAAIRRDLWAALPYDEDLTGLEDLEWARRAIGKGYILSYVAESIVVHVHVEDWSRVRNRYRREAIAHRRIYDEQRLGAWEAATLAVRHIASDYRAALRVGVLRRNLLGIPAFHAAQFIGAYQGFAQVGDASGELKRRFYYPQSEHGPGTHSDVIGRSIDYSSQEGSVC